MPSRRFRITVVGRLSSRFTSRFAGVVGEPADRGTALVGEFADRTQLDILLGRIADCGLQVASVEELGDGRPGDPPRGEV